MSFALNRDLKIRLRVVSNFVSALPSRRVSSKFRARACILPAPQSPSPKLETTRSLPKNGGCCPTQGRYSRAFLS